MNKAVILMGLPLSGKSTFVNQRRLDLMEELVPMSDLRIVSADELKEGHLKYDPNNTEPLHEWSVREAEALMIQYSNENIPHLIMDGGGINNSYTIRIINMLKQKNYYVELVHIKTPLHVCLNRNDIRERKVPREAIITKAGKERAQFVRLVPLVDKVSVIEYFSHKNIFFDMDGVLAGFPVFPRINGRIDFVNSQFFRYLDPVIPVKEKVKELWAEGHNIYILSAIPNSISYIEKNEWLDTHYPFIKKENRYFVNSGRHKAEMLHNLTQLLKMNKQDVTLVDDHHNILDDVDKLEMRPMHISEFLTYKF